MSLRREVRIRVGTDPRGVRPGLCGPSVLLPTAPQSCRGEWLEAQPGMLDRDAAVLYDRHTGLVRPVGRRSIDDAELRPDHPERARPVHLGIGVPLDAGGDSIRHDGREILSPAKYRDDIQGYRHIDQRGVDLTSKDRLANVLGIDRIESVSLFLQVGGHFIAGALRTGRQADHGDVPSQL